MGDRNFTFPTDMRRFKDIGLPKALTDVVYRYPCNLSVLRRAQGIIVHSANSLRLAEQWYGADLANWSVIPLLRDTHVSSDKARCPDRARL